MSDKKKTTPTTKVISNKAKLGAALIAGAAAGVAAVEVESEINALNQNPQVNTATSKAKKTTEKKFIQADVDFSQSSEDQLKRLTLERQKWEQRALAAEASASESKVNENTTNASLINMSRRVLKAEENNRRLKAKADRLQEQLDKARAQHNEQSDYSLEQQKQIDRLRDELIFIKGRQIDCSIERVNAYQEIKNLSEELEKTKLAYSDSEKDRAQLRQDLAKMKVQNTIKEDEANNKKVAFNPFDYMKSGENMGVVIYTSILNDGTEVMSGVETCKIGKYGPYGCSFTYASSGNEKVHKHFVENVHVTRALGYNIVYCVHPNGKFQRWNRGEYHPDEYYPTVLHCDDGPLKAIRIQEQQDGTQKIFAEDRPAVLKKAMDLVSRGTSRIYYATERGMTRSGYGR